MKTNFRTKSAELINKLFLFFLFMLFWVLHLQTIGSCSAADFSGELKSISVTDTEKTNQPPVPVINYAQDGKKYTFDASSSADKDGIIADYKWDFGDGNTGAGSIVNHDYIVAGEYNVTLTIIDNKDGVGLTHKIIPVGIVISDDFSTNTSENYTKIIGGLTVSDGSAHGYENTVSQVYHNTSLGSVNHWVKSDLYHGGGNDGPGLAVRVDNLATTGYLAYFNGSSIELYRFSAGSRTRIALHNGSYGAGKYKLKVTIEGSEISVEVNDTPAIKTIDTTFTTGQHIGMFFFRKRLNTDVTVDNISAGL